MVEQTCALSRGSAVCVQTRRDLFAWFPANIVDNNGATEGIMTYMCRWLSTYQVLNIVLPATSCTLPIRLKIVLPVDPSLFLCVSHLVVGAFCFVVEIVKDNQLMSLSVHRL